MLSFLTVVAVQTLLVGAYAWQKHYPGWWHTGWLWCASHSGQLGHWWALHQVGGHLYYKFKGTMCHLPYEYSVVELHAWGYLRYRRWWRHTMYPRLVGWFPGWGYFTTFVVWLPHRFFDSGERLGWAAVVRLNRAALALRYSTPGVSRWRPPEAARRVGGGPHPAGTPLVDYTWLEAEPTFYHLELEPFQEPALDKFDNQQDDATDEESDWTILGDLQWGAPAGLDRTHGEPGRPGGARPYREAPSKWRRENYEPSSVVEELRLNRRDCFTLNESAPADWDLYRLVEPGDGPNVPDSDADGSVWIDLWQSRLLDWFFLMSRTRRISELPTFATRYTHLLLNTRRSNPRTSHRPGKQYSRRVGLFRWLLQRRPSRARRARGWWERPARPPDATNGYARRFWVLWRWAARRRHRRRGAPPPKVPWWVLTYEPALVALQWGGRPLTPGAVGYRWRRWRRRRPLVARWHAPRYHPAHLGNRLVEEGAPGYSGEAGAIGGVPDPRPGWAWVAVSVLLGVVGLNWWDSLGSGVYQERIRPDWIAEWFTQTEWWYLRVDPPTGWFNHARARSNTLWVTWGGPWSGIDANLAHWMYSADYLFPQGMMLNWYHSFIEWFHLFHHGALVERGVLGPHFFLGGRTMPPFHSSWLWWYGNTKPGRMRRGLDYMLTHPDWEFWNILPSVTLPEPFRRVHFDFLHFDPGWYFWGQLDNNLEELNKRPHWLEHWYTGRHRQQQWSALFKAPTWVDPRTALGHTKATDPWGMAWSVSPPRWLRLWEAVWVTQNVLGDYLEPVGLHSLRNHADTELSYPKWSKARSAGFTYDLVPQPWEIHYNTREVAAWSAQSVDLYKWAHHRNDPLAWSFQWPTLPSVFDAPPRWERWWWCAVGVGALRSRRSYLSVLVAGVAAEYTPGGRGGQPTVGGGTDRPNLGLPPRAALARRAAQWGQYRLSPPGRKAHPAGVAEWDYDPQWYNQDVFVPGLNRGWSAAAAGRRTGYPGRGRWLTGATRPPLYRGQLPVVTPPAGWLRRRRARQIVRDRTGCRWWSTRERRRNRRLVRRAAGTGRQPYLKGHLILSRAASSDAAGGRPGSPPGWATAMAWATRVGFQTRPVAPAALSQPNPQRRWGLGWLVGPTGRGADLPASRVGAPRPPLKRSSREVESSRFVDPVNLTQAPYHRRGRYGRHMWSKHRDARWGVQTVGHPAGVGPPQPVGLPGAPPQPVCIQHAAQLARWRALLAGVNPSAPGWAEPNFGRSPWLGWAAGLDGPPSELVTEVFDEDVDEEEMLGENHTDEEEELSPDFECVVEVFDGLDYLDAPSDPAVVAAAGVASRVAAYARWGALPGRAYRWAAPATHLGGAGAGQVRWSPWSVDHPGATPLVSAGLARVGPPFSAHR